MEILAIYNRLYFTAILRMKHASRSSIISRKPEETFLIGKIVGENLTGGDVVALIGELGTGKTCFTQGIAKGIDIPEGYRITSPSFTLINEYQGRVRLFHFDLYRLQGVHDMEDMGFEEYLYGDAVSVVEWADKMEGILPESTIFVAFKYIDENEREIEISGVEEKVSRIVNALRSGGF